MKVGKPYFRKKRKSIAIEVKVDSKSKHLRTLPSPVKLLKQFYPMEYQKYIGFLNGTTPTSVPKIKASNSQELKSKFEGEE